MRSFRLTVVICVTIATCCVHAAEYNTEFSDLDSWPTNNDGHCYAIAALEVARYEFCRQFGLDRGEYGLYNTISCLAPQRRMQLLEQVWRESRVQNSVDSLLLSMPFWPRPEKTVAEVARHVKAGRVCMVLIGTDSLRGAINHAVVCIGLSGEDQGSPEAMLTVEDSNCPRTLRSIYYDREAARWEYPYDMYKGRFLRVTIISPDDAVIKQVQRNHFKPVLAATRQEESVAPRGTDGVDRMDRGAYPLHYYGEMDWNGRLRNGPVPSPANQPRYFAELWADRQLTDGWLVWGIKGQELVRQRISKEMNPYGLSGFVRRGKPDLSEFPYEPRTVWHRCMDEQAEFVISHLQLDGDPMKRETGMYLTMHGSRLDAPAGGNANHPSIPIMYSILLRPRN